MKYMLQLNRLYQDIVKVTKVLIKFETDEGELEIQSTVIHCTESVGMPLVGVTFDLAD